MSLSPGPADRARLADASAAARTANGAAQPDGALARPEPTGPLLTAAGVSSAELAEVLTLLAGTDLVELEVSFGATRLSLRRPASPPAALRGVAPPVADNMSLAIASPLVGIFHPSVSTGDSVSAGQPIGAIESLGMPTTVDAPQGGTVDQLLVEDGNPVEYGQPLVVLRRGGTQGD